MANHEREGNTMEEKTRERLKKLQALAEHGACRWNNKAHTRKDDRAALKRGIDMAEQKLFRAYWKETGKEYKAGHWGFIKAVDKEDARCVMQQNLQTGYEVTEITDAHEHQITMQAICVNFPNTAEPLGFG